MSVKKDTYKIQAQTIIKNLARRNMEGFYCDTKEDAVKKALEIMEKGSVIAWGGSESIWRLFLTEVMNLSTARRL